MAYSLTKHSLRLVIPIAGVFFLSAVATGLAQSRVAETRAASPSAVANGTANGTPASQNGQKNRVSAARNNGRTAKNRSSALVGNAASPVALALEDSGPGPSSTPEPLSVILIGGALAGLYGVRRHLS